MMNVMDVGKKMIATETRMLTLSETMRLSILIELEVRKVALLPEELENFTFQVMRRRLDAKISDHLVYFWSLLADRPGVAVLFAAMILASDTRTLVDAMKHTPLGRGNVPTDEAMRRVWDEQKLANGSNAVDRVVA